MQPLLVFIKMAWIDGHCNFRDAELLKHMASGDFDSEYSVLARQYRMALWTMYRLTTIYFSFDCRSFSFAIL